MGTQRFVHWSTVDPQSFFVFVVLQEQKFCQRYDQLMEAWEKKVERIENNPRRRAKESKVREYYEKQFPEIRKQRELQERMQRWDFFFFPFHKCSVCKSTANWYYMASGKSNVL